MAGEISDDELIEVTVRLPRSAINQSLGVVQTHSHGSEAARLAVAKALLAGRRKLAQMFAGTRFAEPLWEIILELYIATAERRQFKVIKLCTASGGSVTTALRHIEDLERRGYISREADPHDGRSAIVVMQPSLQTLVDDWFDQFTSLIPC